MACFPTYLLVRVHTIISILCIVRSVIITVTIKVYYMVYYVTRVLLFCANTLIAFARHRRRPGESSSLFSMAFKSALFIFFCWSSYTTAQVQLHRYGYCGSKESYTQHCSIRPHFQRSPNTRFGAHDPVHSELSHKSIQVSRYSTVSLYRRLWGLYNSITIYENHLYRRAPGNNPTCRCINQHDMCASPFCFIPI